MAERRSYTKREKLTAVIAADMTTQEAAAAAAGVPRTTLRRWIEDPDLAELRQKARESLAEEMAVIASLASMKLAEAIMAGKVDPRDLITALGVAVDKSQLLSGQPTGRLETRDLTESLDDHERAALRDILDRAIEEAAAADAGSDPVGAGTALRE